MPKIKEIQSRELTTQIESWREHAQKTGKGAIIRDYRKPYDLHIEPTGKVVGRKSIQPETSDPPWYK